MNGKPSKWSVVLGGCLLIAMVAMATPATADTDGDLKSRLEHAEARLAELETKQSQSWLEGQRVEEVKMLVREVLADADTRASLLEGSSAGHNGQNFFLSNDDGSFLMMIGGIVQVRHNWNFRDEEEGSSTDVEERGFEIARAKVGFWGHIADPRIKYSVRLAAEREDNEANFDEVLLSYDLMDGMTIWGGETKAPFLREELTSAGHQLAVERSLVNEVFTMGIVQGIGVDWWVDKGSSNMVRLRASINDGVRSGEADGDNAANLHSEDNDSNNKHFDQDNTDFAVTARADVRIMGDWGQGDDFTAWSGEEMSLLVGGALHWEVAETGDSSANNEFLTWTVDGSIESNGANGYAAVVASHDLDNEVLGDATHWGFVAQGGYQVVPDKVEPFVRYEYLYIKTLPSDDDQDLNLLTFGVNWYLNTHNAKFTTDVVWAFDSIPSASSLGIDSDNLSLLGLLPDDSDQEDQVVWRAQFQLLF
jgi:hypothetical protein